MEIPKVFSRIKLKFSVINNQKYLRIRIFDGTTSNIFEGVPSLVTESTQSHSILKNAPTISVKIKTNEKKSLFVIAW